MSIGIYKITNPKGKRYIGKSKDIKNRFKSYKKLQHCKFQIKLYNSFKKYSPENHIFEVIEECDINDLNKREKYWIKKLNVINNGLNLTFGGDGGERSLESEEKRRKNSLKLIYQYDIDGNFIKEWESAVSVIQELKLGNSNNINDCARGVYNTTYGFRWKYATDVNFKKIKLKEINLSREKFLLKINNELINIFKGWKQLKEYGISLYCIKKCLDSESGIFINKKTNIKYEITKYNKYLNKKL